jgi:thiol-disulfide isomerase/thioredoxin
MKRLIPILIISILIGCKTNVDNWSTIKISGEINVPDISNLWFYPFESLAEDENLMQNIQINEDGFFRILYSLNKPINALIMIEDKKLMIYIEPGEDLYFNVNDDFQIEIIDDIKDNNSFFLDYQHRFVPFFTSNLNYQLNPKHFIHQIDSITHEKNTFLEANNKRLCKNFIDNLENDITYFAAKEKIYYSRRYASHLIKNENQYFDFLNTIDIQNDLAINVPNYLDFIDNYINYLYLKKIWGIGTDYKNDYIEKYYIAKSVLKGQVLEQFLTENLFLGLDHPVEKEKFNEILIEFLTGNYSEKLKNILKRKLSDFKNSKFAEGKIAPEFSLKNRNNNACSLSNFQGKYVVLNFWASWCSPCRRAIPLMIELSEEYKDVAQFIFISVDGNLSNWDNACSQLEIPEPCLIIDSITRGNYEFDKSVSVPLYLVLDDKGRVVSRNPTNEEIESILKSKKE